MLAKRVFKSTLFICIPQSISREIFLVRFKPSLSGHCYVIVTTRLVNYLKSDMS
jgi:hypothetical protein